MQVATKTRPLVVTQLPNSCPFCHKTIIPVPLYGNIIDDEDIEVYIACPNESCKKSFIAYYENLGVRNNLQHTLYINKVSIGNQISEQFSETIELVSPAFVSIYNEAYQAEQYYLLEICGVGYRKAIEFLIKDYCKIKHPDKINDIEKRLLGSVIDTYVDEARIKSVAKRAVWLGNDETHYIRKWQEKDLNDLKALISLTLHWIEMEALTKKFEEEMPH
jgi:hypothetical protein